MYAHLKMMGTIVFHASAGLLSPQVQWISRSLCARCSRTASYTLAEITFITSPGRKSIYITIIQIVQGYITHMECEWAWLSAIKIYLMASIQLPATLWQFYDAAWCSIIRVHYSILVYVIVGKVWRLKTNILIACHCIFLFQGCSFHRSCRDVWWRKP